MDLEGRVCSECNVLQRGEYVASLYGDLCLASVMF